MVNRAALVEATSLTGARESTKELNPRSGFDLDIKHHPTYQRIITPVNAHLVGAANKKFIQQVCWKFLFYGRAVDSTILTSLSAITSQQANPTTNTMAKAKQLLDYLAS